MKYIIIKYIIIKYIIIKYIIIKYIIIKYIIIKYMIQYTQINQILPLKEKVRKKSSVLPTSII